MDVEPEKLFEYARKFADRNEVSGRGTKFPTVRAAAKRFRCKQSDITMAVEDGAGQFGCYFGISIGMQTGGGYGVYDSEGDYEIEAYRWTS